MARLKYAEGAEPLRNEHSGFTFQPNNYGQSTYPGAKNDRKRYWRQFDRMQCNQKAVRFWRTMPEQVKSVWIQFAATFPQVSRRDPSRFLTGYELFIKRNSYCFLNHGVSSDFMFEPELTVVEGENIDFRIRASNTAIDATENYIRNFGLLPCVGDRLLLYAVAYGEKTGQFFEPVSRQVEVEEVYIDGLFIDVQVPDTFPDVVVSVFLSIPKRPGETYPGTKTRYMGCFTPKKFTELQDVPVPEQEQAGWLWGVNPVTLEWELRPPGGAAASPPLTITSTTENQTTAEGHTHELNQLHPIERSAVFSSVTIDKKGRVTSLSSGDVINSVWKYYNSNANNSDVVFFPLPWTVFNFDFFFAIISEFSADNRIGFLAYDVIYVFLRRSGSTVLEQTVQVIHSNISSIKSYEVIWTINRFEIRADLHVRGTYYYNINVANMGH